MSCRDRGRMCWFSLRGCGTTGFRMRYCQNGCGRQRPDWEPGDYDETTDE